MEDAEDMASVASDFSILPEAIEVEAMSKVPAFLLSNSDEGHSQVEFLNVCSNYPNNQDLVLHYRFTAYHKPSVTDRLALYKVGFASPQHYLLYEWAPRYPLAVSPADLVKEDEQSSSVFSVTFAKNRLPRDASEFYQVCYVREEQTIRGVSKPFQLLKDHESANSSLSSDIIVSLDQSDGSVLIASDLSTLHSNNKMLQECVQRVHAEKINVEEQLEGVNQQLKGKLEQIEKLQETIKELTETNEQEHSAAASATAAAEKEVHKLEEERKTLLQVLEEAREAVGKAHLERDALQFTTEEQRITVQQCEGTIEEFKARLQEKDQQLLAAVNQLEALKEKQSLVEKELRKCQEERDVARKEVDVWTKSAAADKNNIHKLENEFSAANDELIEHMEALFHKKTDLEKSKETLSSTKEELTLEREKLNQLQKTLSNCQQELQDSQDRQRVLDSDNSALQNNLHAMRDTCESLKEKLKVEREECAGTEQVAAELSKRSQGLTHRCSQLEQTNKKLVDKCKALSNLVIKQNVADNIEELVGLHDFDSDMDASLTAGSTKEEETATNTIEEETSAAPPVPAVVSAAAELTTPVTIATTLGSVSSSLAALELSGSVDSHMSCMMEELLTHVKQLKTMMGPGQNSAAETSSQVHKTETVKDNDAELTLVEEEPVQKSTDNSPEQSFVHVTEGNPEGEKENSTTLSHAKECFDESTICEDKNDEAEVFVDAPTRPSSTVINIESEEQEKPNNENTAEKPKMQLTSESVNFTPLQHQNPPSFPNMIPLDQTAPVFLPPRNIPPTATNNSQQAFYSQGPIYTAPSVIPLPFPPAFPAPIGHPSCGFFPPPPPPPPPAFPPAPGVVPSSVESGLAPPLVPEVTSSARHAALLSTIGAAAAQAIQSITSTLTPPVAEEGNTNTTTETDEQPKSGPRSHNSSSSTQSGNASAETASNNQQQEQNAQSSENTNTDSGSSSQNAGSGENPNMNWSYGNNGRNGYWAFGSAAGQANSSATGDSFQYSGPDFHCNVNAQQNHPNNFHTFNGAGSFNFPAGNSTNFHRSFMNSGFGNQHASRATMNAARVNQERARRACEQAKAANLQRQQQYQQTHLMRQQQQQGCQSQQSIYGAQYSNHHANPQQHAMFAPHNVNQHAHQHAHQAAQQHAHQAAQQHAHQAAQQHAQQVHEAVQQAHQTVQQAHQSAQEQAHAAAHHARQLGQQAQEAAQQARQAAQQVHAAVHQQAQHIINGIDLNSIATSAGQAILTQTINATAAAASAPVSDQTTSATDESSLSSQAQQKDSLLYEDDVEDGNVKQQQEGENNEEQQVNEVRQNQESPQQNTEDQGQLNSEDQDDNETQQATTEVEMLSCPFCDVVFSPCERGAMLVNEHIDSHLAHICPVCSLAFSLAERERFETHVNSHFDGRAATAPAESNASGDQEDDPSGPWARARRIMEID